MKTSDRSRKQATLRQRATDTPREIGGRSSTEEFFFAAIQLAELTETFFGPDKSLASLSGELDGQYRHLLGLYDEFLDILEEELQSTSQPASIPLGFDGSKRDRLIRLHTAIDYNRELIAGLCAAMQEAAGK
jgi:hypothetical protein